MQLINDGIYLLPDGREVIASKVDGIGYHLLDPRSGVAAAPVYFVGTDGKISFWGKPVPWRVTDLKDTGRRARSSMRSLELVKVDSV